MPADTPTVPEFLDCLAGTRPATRRVVAELITAGRWRFGPGGCRLVWEHGLAALRARAQIAHRTMQRAIGELGRAGLLVGAFGAQLSLRWARPLGAVGAQPRNRGRNDDGLSTDPPLRGDRSGDHHASANGAPDPGLQADIAAALREKGVHDWWRWTRLYPTEAIVTALDRLYDMPAAESRRVRNPAGMLRTWVRGEASA